MSSRVIVAKKWYVSMNSMDEFGANAIGRSPLRYLKKYLTSQILCAGYVISASLSVWLIDFDVETVA